MRINTRHQKFQKILLTVAAVVALVSGCSEETDSLVSESVEQIVKIPEQIQDPDHNPHSHDLAMKIHNKIKEVRDSETRRRLLGKFEEAVYSVPPNDPDFRKRERQFRAFYDFADTAASCVLAIGEAEETYWEKRIRLIKEMQRLIGLVPRRDIPLNDHSSKVLELYAREHYIKSLTDDFNLHVRNYEEFFNTKTCKRLSAERCDAIRRRLEDVLGRKIRSMEEIAKERWGR